MANRKVKVSVTRNYFKTIEVEIEINENIEDIQTELIEGKSAYELDNLVEEALGNASLNGGDETWSFQSSCGMGGTL